MINSFDGYEEKSLNDLYLKPLEQILEMPLEKRNIRWFKLVKMYSRKAHLRSPGKKQDMEVSFLKIQSFLYLLEQ
jgi:hypothetical protein